DMRSRIPTLTMLEVAVGGRDCPRAWFDSVVIGAKAHRAAGLAPLKAGIAEDLVQPLGLGCALDLCRAWNHQREHALRHFAAANNPCGLLEIREPGVGAGADESHVDRRTVDGHPGLETHVVQRPLNNLATVGVGY